MTTTTTTTIESVIQKLLTPDNLLIKQNTKQLLDFYASEKCVPGLFDVIKSGGNPQVRIYAATVLRRKLKNWRHLREQDTSRLRSETIDVMIREPDESARRQLMWLVATIYKHISTTTITTTTLTTTINWPQLLEFIDRSIMGGDNNTDDVEMMVQNDGDTTSTIRSRSTGLALLAALIDECAEEVKPYYLHRIVPNLVEIMSDESEIKSSVYALTTLNHMLPYLSSLELASLDPLLEYCVSNLAVRLLTSESLGHTSKLIDTTASTVMVEFFQSLVDYECPFVAAHIRTIVARVLAITLDTRLAHATRVTFAGFLNVLVETHKCVLVREALVASIAETAFFLMVGSSDPFEIKSQLESELLTGETNRTTFDDAIMIHDVHTNGEMMLQSSSSTMVVDVDETENVFSAACQVLDYCALNFPSRILVPVVIECARAHMLSENPLSRRASLASLAITCQSCADFYKSHCIDLLAESCLRGMQDTDPAVCQLAYFALSQLCEILDPLSATNLTKPRNNNNNNDDYIERIMRVFIESIESRLALRSVSRLTLRFYGALQSFCDNLGSRRLDRPRLATLMSKLMTLELICSSSLKIKRLMLATFSSVVAAVRTRFEPYFDYVLQLVKPHLRFEFDDETAAGIGTATDPTLIGSRSLEIECIELMAALARYSSPRKFNSILVQNSLVLVHAALNADRAVCEPEVRAAAYHLLAGLSGKLKRIESTSSMMMMTSLVARLLDTLRSDDGLAVNNNMTNNDVIVAANNEHVNPDEPDDIEDLFAQFDQDQETSDDVQIDSQLEPLIKPSSTIGEDNSDLKRDDERDDGDDDDTSSYCDLNDNLVVEHAYVSEKLAAMSCLRDLIKSNHNQSTFLLDYYDDAYGELKRLAVSYVDVNVRKDAFLTLAHLISAAIKSTTSVRADQTVTTTDSQRRHVVIDKLSRHVDEFVRRAVRCIELELNRELVMGVLAACKILLARLTTTRRVTLTRLEKLATLVEATLDGRIYCQTINKIASEKPDNREDFCESEYDFLLKQFAGDLVPALAKSCGGFTSFGPFFTHVLRYCCRLVERPVDVSASESEKSFAIGLAGQLVENLGASFFLLLDNHFSLAQQLFTKFYPLLASESQDLRANTVYTLSVIVSTAVSTTSASTENPFSSVYPQLISDIYRLAEAETSNTPNNNTCSNNPRVLDSLCGALARLLCASSSSRIVEYELVAKRMLELTPLRVDFAEYKWPLAFLLKCDDWFRLHRMRDYFTRATAACAHVLRLHAQAHDQTQDDDDQDDDDELFCYEYDLINDNTDTDTLDETRELAMAFLKWLHANLTHAEFELLLASLAGRKLDVRIIRRNFY